MSIQLFIVCAYIVLLFGISFWAKKRADKGSAEYLFAGRKLSSMLIAVNITGLAVGAASTVGVAEKAYNIGMAAGWYNAAWSAGAVIMGLVAAGKYRALRATTIPELFERYYDTKGRLISALGLVIIMLVITSLQYLAGGAILSALLPDVFSFKGGMLTSAVVFIGITLIGGLWSSGLSNIVSVCLIYVGVLYSAFTSVNNVGGLAALQAALPQATNMLSPVSGMSLSAILAFFVIMITQAITAQGPVQIACGAKDAASAKRGFLYGAALIFPIGFLCALLGIVARVSFPDISATMALPKVVMSLNPWASGATLAAMWAADVSTACTILLAAGTLFAQDIYKRFLHPNISDEKFMLVNRLTVLGCGILTLWLAFNAVGILKTMLAGLSMTAPLTIVFLFTVFAPGLCKKNAAFYTTLVGLLGIVAWAYLPALHIFQDVIYFEWVICVITFLLVYLIDPTPIKTPKLEEED